MDVDPMTWVVHRSVVDPCLDELDADAAPTGLGRWPMVPRDLWDLDSEVLRELALAGRKPALRTRRGHVALRPSPAS